MSVVAGKCSGTGSSCTAQGQQFLQLSLREKLQDLDQLEEDRMPETSGRTSPQVIASKLFEYFALEVVSKT